MKREEALQIVFNALSGYVEDCAGAESEEAKEIQQAWELINKKPELTIQVPLEEDELERMQHEGEEFEWEFPTDEDPEQSIKVILKKAEDE